MGGEVVLAGIAPHPPIMVPEVGGVEAEKVIASRRAMAEMARLLQETQPETVVLISPHSTVFADGVAINGLSEVEGDLSYFRAPQVRLKFSVDRELAAEVAAEARELGVTVAVLDREKARRLRADLSLDHGMMVPLYFLQQGMGNARLLPVAMSLLPGAELYAFGLAVQRAAAKLGRRIAVIASGDLSHRLQPGAPAGYSPRGEEFDHLLVELVRKGDVPGIINIDPVLAEEAGECGWRSIIMMLGALDGLAVEPRVLSYEGPFGVGYLVAVFLPRGKDENRRLLADLLDRRRRAVEERRKGESPYVRLARKALEEYVKHGRVIDPPDPLPEEFRRRAGVFVSIKKHGQLRGCIGTIAPTTDNIAAEIIRNAIQAGTADPRFFPVEEDELDELVYSVDILKEPEPVGGLEDLDPKKYGVIVRSGFRSGLLLPNLEGIDTAEEQVRIARQKAGIGPDEPVRLERFEVERYY
ncbi:MAG: hypothetical protein PWQ31_1087 [Eubacteriales bacterium]|nr:hypothetical protein [Eubacteriales bacterium]